MTIIFILAGFFIGWVIRSFYTEQPEPKIIIKGIDPDELVEWIENATHNYEYLAPPTAGEIIKKINAMALK